MLRAARSRKLRVALASALALALALEGAVRVRQKLRYGTFGPVHEFARDERSGLDIPVPGRVTGPIRINRLGFRGPEIEVEKPPGLVRIACLGGSTTFCAEASSEDATWPARLQALLRERFPGRAIEVVNAGVAGYTLDRVLVNLERRVAPLDPDVVLVYEATNDLTRDTRELAIAQQVYTGHADSESWLSRVSLAWYLGEKNWRLRSRQRAAAGAAGRVSFEPRELSRGFEQRLRAVVESARSRAKLVVMMTFATQVRREQSPEQRLAACNTSLYYMPYMSPELLLDGFDEYNRVVRAVAADAGALLVETAGAVPGDRVHFADSVHLTDEGCRLFAETVAAALAADPRFRALAGAD